MSKIKAFPFWKKQYLFHPEATSNITLLRLYHPYNSIAKLNWWLWKNLAFYQTLFTYTLHEDSKLNKFIKKFTEVNRDYVWLLNRGTKSKYQKTTGLFVSKKTKDSHVNFFFKWGDSKPTIESIKNEAAILNELKPYSFSPKLIQFQSDEHEAYYITEIIQGTKYTSMDANSDVLNLIHDIQRIHPVQVKNYCSSDTLLTSLHHGDFGPWNLIVEEKTQLIKAIDWEFCGIYPKGFDLFYYIFSIEFLIMKNTRMESIITKKYAIIDNYFKALGIKDWNPYLKEFAYICSKRNSNTKIGDNFLKLYNYCNRP